VGSSRTVRVTGSGAGSGAGADPARQEAEVILTVGSRLGNLGVSTDRCWGEPAGQQLIQIDGRRTSMDRSSSASAPTTMRTWHSP